MNSPKYKYGDWVYLKPDADVTLSYEDDSPPQETIAEAIWVIDGIEEVEDTFNYNISTLELQPEAGNYCAFVLEDDIAELVRRPR